MLSEALDITIETRGDSIWIILSGIFSKEQVPNIRIRIEDLCRDGNKQFVVDMQGITQIDESAALMFLGLLSTIKGKGGDIRLVFKNEAVSKAFGSYRHNFSIYPDEKSVTTNTLLHRLWRRGIFLRKKTGIRVSVPVALFLLFILTGWFISLGVIITMQRKQLHQQEVEMKNFKQWKRDAEIELTQLKSRLKPMIQLGLISDSLPKK